MSMLGLGQAISPEVVRRVEVISGRTGEVVYPSQSPEDYPQDWAWSSTGAPSAADQQAALSWLSAAYPGEVVEGVETTVDASGTPVFRITVTGTSPDAARAGCPQGTIIPCVPNWMLWVGIGLVVLAMRRR